LSKIFSKAQIFDEILTKTFLSLSTNLRKADGETKLKKLRIFFSESKSLLHQQCPILPEKSSDMAENSKKKSNLYKKFELFFQTEFLKNERIFFFV